MKKQIQILLLTVLILSFSACSNRKYSIDNLKLPNVQLFGEKKLDRSLSTVKGLQTKSNMSQVALQWTPKTEENIAGYRIYRGDSRGNYKLIATLTDKYSSHYVDRNINDYIDYSVSVYTEDGRESKARSIKKRAKRLRLTKPEIIEVSNDYPDRVKIIWKLKEKRKGKVKLGEAEKLKEYNFIKSYIVQRKGKNTTQWVNIATLSSGLSAEYIDKDVRAGEIYYYRVRSQALDGTISIPSNAVKGSSKKLPRTIPWIKATDNLARVIQITWESRNNISHYNLYSSSLKDSLYTFLAKTKKRSYTDKFDVDGITRYYRVTAEDKYGLESRQSVMAIGKTIAAANAPVIESALVKENYVQLKWKAAGSARKFTIVKKYWDKFLPQKEEITDYKSTIYRDSKIKPDKRYTYYIISYDKVGVESLPSKEVVLSIRPR